MERKNDLLYKYLIDNIPTFNTFLEEDEDSFFIDEEAGVILYHVLMGNLARFFINNYKKGRSLICEQIIKALDSIYVKNSDLYSNPEGIENLVAVSFLESLHNVGNKRDYEIIRGMLPLKMAKDLDRLDKNLGYPFPD